MRASTIIEIFQKDYKPDDNVIVAWWNKETFESSQAITKIIDEGRWVDFVNRCDNLDWSDDCNAFEYVANEMLTES